MTNMDKQKIKKTAAIAIGAVLAILILVMGFNLLANVFTRASDNMPREVIVSDITQNSAKISWTTGVENQGVVIYGTNPTTLTFNTPETTRLTSHLLDLTLLSSSTTYYFQITIDGKNYDNSGVPWTFTTKAPVVTSPTFMPTPVPLVKSGDIENAKPIQSLRISDTGADVSVCSETDCATIKLKLGKGCTTQDYFKCVRKLTPTP